jgi:hypothetical protein
MPSAVYRCTSARATAAESSVEPSSTTTTWGGRTVQKGSQ